ncbi:hypothetical protein [Ensifer aridi]|uniref:hypothetical protein n=1 Tax=Ensifer aridi TaxID=1708715 RepID=UPI001FCD3DA9|nr:hypothetical protein [Ensifer aridi]
MKDLNLLAHRIPSDFFDCLFAAIDLKVGQQLPLDALAAGRRIGLDRVNDGKIQCRISLLLADGRQHPDPFEADIQIDFGDLIGIGANFDEMPADSFNIAHFSRYCVIPVAGQAVDDRAHDEVRAELLGQAVELVDITFAVADMNASVWLTEKVDGLTQILKPTDAFLGFDRNTCRIDLAFELGCTPELVAAPELDGRQP